MERTKQKAKKEKPNKYVDKEKSPSFIADVKALKENLKIREILRTVKMNSSMRIKAPRGSKVMQNQDFHDGEDIFEDTTSADGQNSSGHPSATNLHIVNNAADSVTSESESANDESSQVDLNASEENLEEEVEINVLHKSKSLSEGLEDSGAQRVSTPTSPGSPTVLPPLESPLLRARERKLSLDHTMLSKREGLSQSEVDLHSIGKSPLERKSSFFRKKMDSFLKNTTEIFKRQNSKSLQRRESTCSRMSVSMQSLNENEAYNGEYDTETLDKYDDELRGSVTSLRSSMTPARSNSSLSASQSDRNPPDQSEASSVVGSQPDLGGSQPLGDMPSTISSLSGGYNQESFLHSRAISMSSGLDSAHGPRKRKTSRSNRVTWVASESLTDYFRRLIQDEKTRELHGCHSYQDFSTIPENISPSTDSKGRRLSYQRAVSGEDPVLPTRYQDSNLRSRKITETAESNNEISNHLAEFARSGVPALKGFTVRVILDDALAYLLWAESEQNLEEHFDWKKLSPRDEARQAVIKELIFTEVDHIRYLRNIVEIYIATAHALQNLDKLLNFETSKLFLNIPDILNANMRFWEQAMFPMILDSFVNKSEFNPDLMAPGFAQFAEIFEPYEEFVCDQFSAMDYLRAFTNNTDFMTYLTWCNNRDPNNRLQLNDIMVKPMQRLTKYSLIIRRIITYTDGEESKKILIKMEKSVVAFVHRVNRAIRRMEEIEKLEDLEKTIDPFELEFRDDDLDFYFHMMNDLNFKTPMVNCGPDISRTIVYQGDLRFKDNLKEVDVRAILLTDMLLICKKLKEPPKGSSAIYKMIRPKFMIEKTIPFARFSNRNNLLEVTGLIYVVLDEQGSATTAFCLTEPHKDPNPQLTLKIWDQKIREARVSYELSVWFYKNPVKDLADIERDYSAANFKKNHSEDWLVERRARERVATMMAPKRRSSMVRVAAVPREVREPGRGPPNLRQYFHRASTGGSSRNSRLSSFQHSMSSRNSRLSSFQKSASGASHDEPLNALKYLYRAGSSVEHLIPPQNTDDVARSITVNIVSENEGECDTVVPSIQPSLLVLQQSLPSHSQNPRSASAGGSENTLRVSPQHSLVHSLPDLSVEQIHPLIRPTPPPAVQLTASEKLYQSHQELLLRNKLAASHHYLTPDHRGTSYPPPNLTRASLKRGLAFSHSIKNPPLSKMGHVLSQSQAHIDLSQPSTSQTKISMVQQLSQEPLPGTSGINSHTKKLPTWSKTGMTGMASSPEPVKDKNYLNSENPNVEDSRRSPKGKSYKSNTIVKNVRSRSHDSRKIKFDNSPTNTQSLHRHGRRAPSIGNRFRRPRRCS